MPADIKAGDRDDQEDTGTFTISIYAGESGRLIREYAMEENDGNVSCIEDAERAARSKLASASFADVVVVITEETVTALNQVQWEMAATTARVS